MLDQMEAHQNGYPIPFSLTYVTHNIKGVACGRIINLNNVVLARNASGKQKTQNATPESQSKSASVKAENIAVSSDIRRLYDTKTGKIQNAYLRLITHFNDKEVLF
jgi:hypothetical protein